MRLPFAAAGGYIGRGRAVLPPPTDRSRRRLRAGVRGRERPQRPRQRGRDGALRGAVPRDRRPAAERPLRRRGADPRRLPHAAAATAPQRRRRRPGHELPFSAALERAPWSLRGPPAPPRRLNRRSPPSRRAPACARAHTSSSLWRTRCSVSGPSSPSRSRWPRSPSSAGAAPPAPCNNAPQITDASGDGHHAARTCSPPGGRRPRAGCRPSSRSAPASGWPSTTTPRSTAPASRCTLQRRTQLPARPHARPQDRAERPRGLRLRHVHGAGDAHARQGTTTGVDRARRGRDGDDRRAGGVAPAGTRLTGVRTSITYDGINDGVPTWVDHAPGGDAARPTRRVGADYVVGSCIAGGAADDHDGGARSTAPTKVTGRKTVTVSGQGHARPRRACRSTLTRTATARRPRARVDQRRRRLVQRPRRDRRDDAPARRPPRASAPAS